MNLVQGILLGFLQGVTEWLPISSSGQSMLVLINLLQVTPDEAFSISVALHLGSLFAVLFYFRKRLVHLAKDKELLQFLVVATAASALIGLPAYLGLRNLFSSASGEVATMFIGLMLIFTGLMLRKALGTHRKEYNLGDTFFTGAAQGAAVLPGVSRSGTTITALLLRGVEQETALSLSFIMAIPAIMGLFVLDFAETGLTTISAPLLAGVTTSFLVSLATMHYLMSLSRRIDFSGFALAIGSIAFFVPLAIIAIEWAL